MKKQTKWIARTLVITAGICAFSTNPVLAMAESVITEENVVVGIGPGETQNVVDDGINDYRILYDQLSEEQKADLRLTVAAEARCLGVEGQMAVTEVIFNRCMSSKWPDDIWSVISEKGQFDGFKKRYYSYVCADETTDLAIETVINNGYPATLQKMVADNGYNVSPYEYDCFATKMQSQCKKGYFLKQTYNGWKHYYGIQR